MFIFFQIINEMNCELIPLSLKGDTVQAANAVRASFTKSAAVMHLSVCAGLWVKR